MEIKRIYTEFPDDEQWRMLSQYSYPNNIQKYFSLRGQTPVPELIDNISGSLLQAQEYVYASKTATLQISPLLLYYGIVNLLNAIGNLITLTKNNINGHGLYISPQTINGDLSKMEIVPVSSVSGAFSVFARCFSDGNSYCDYGYWNVKELLCSIPEIIDDCLSGYDDALPYVLPVETIKRKDITLDRIELERFARFNNDYTILKRMRNRNFYTSAQIMQKYIIIHRKQNYQDNCLYSITGVKYLELSHEKNSQQIYPSMLATHFMLLFCFGFICRYHPEIWNPFVTRDSSGEKLIIEKFLNISRRVIPNIVLNILMGKRIIFSSKEQGEIDLSTNVSLEEIEKIIKTAIPKYFEERGY